MILLIKSPFNSAHFYHQSQWSEEKNRETFGKCFTPYGHGHNYVLEVGLRVSPTSYQTDEKVWTPIVQRLTARLDHEHLNFVIPEFKTVIPTTENIALYFLEQLKAHIPSEKIASVKLSETDTIWTEIRL